MKFPNESYIKAVKELVKDFREGDRDPGNLSIIRGVAMKIIPELWGPRKPYLDRLDEFREDETKAVEAIEEWLERIEI